MGIALLAVVTDVLVAVDVLGVDVLVVNTDAVKDVQVNIEPPKKPIDPRSGRSPGDSDLDRG